LNEVTNALYRRLEQRGIESGLIPGFIKIIADFIIPEPALSLDLKEANRRLHSLGWDEFDLDYHTLQLVIAALEAEDSLNPTAVHHEFDLSHSMANQNTL